MLKNLVISILAAVLCSECPWLQTSSVSERIAIIMGLAIVLFIFLLFLEETVEKARRVREIKRLLDDLRRIRIGEKYE